VLTTETLDRLDQQAARQIGPEMTTAVAIGPGALRELVRGYRLYLDHAHPAYIVDYDAQTITPVVPASADGNSKEQSA
jgi:hypothetical protein